MIHNYYNHAVELFIKEVTMSGPVDVNYELFTEDDKQMLSRMKPFIQEALRLSISEDCEVHVFEQSDGSMGIMYDDCGTWHITFEDPHFSGTYSVGTKFVRVDTNTPSPSSESHKSGSRFLDSLVDSMLNCALGSISNDEIFWSFIKLFRLVHEWRDAFINLNEEIFKMANEHHYEVCVRFTFDGEVLRTYYDEIHDIDTPYDFSFNINDCSFIAHSPYTDKEGIIIDFDEEDAEEEDENEE